MKITEKELRQLIRESIYDRLQQYPTDKPKLDRDDIGTFWAVYKPKGGESLDELFHETSVMEYGTKSNGREPAGFCKSEHRARRMATNLRQSRINELAGEKQNEINAKQKEITKTNAMIGAMKHYYEAQGLLPEASNQRMKQFEDTLAQQTMELKALMKHKKDIEEGKIPEGSNVPTQVAPTSTPAPIVGEDSDIVKVDMNEAKEELDENIPKIGQPSSPHSKANLTNQEKDVVNPGLKEAKKKVIFKRK